MKRRLRLVAADLGFWSIKDKPAPAGIRERKAQLVPDERTHLVGSGRKEHGVHSANHADHPPLFFKPYALLEPPPDLRLIFEVGAAKLRFQVTLFVGDEPAGDPPDEEGHNQHGRQTA